MFKFAEHHAAFRRDLAGAPEVDQDRHSSSSGALREVLEAVWRVDASEEGEQKLTDDKQLMMV